jgi:hypothetical protein
VATIPKREHIPFPIADAEPARPRPPVERLAAVGALAAGLVMLVGTAVDLGVLWFLQRQAGAQWEYVAIANTLESAPRIVLGIAFLYGALHLFGVRALGAYRALAGLMITFGLFAAGMGAIITTSYFALASMVTQPEAYVMLRSIAIKAIALSGLYFIVLVPLGIIGLRRPRT